MVKAEGIYSILLMINNGTIDQIIDTYLLLVDLHFSSLLHEAIAIEKDTLLLHGYYFRHGYL